MNGFIEFEFRPEPAVRSYIWTVRDGHVMRRGGSAMRLSEVKRANWIDISYRGTRSAWLELSDGRNTMKIACTDQGQGSDRISFLRLVMAVMRVLDTDAPELLISTDGNGVIERALFGLSCLGLGLGAALIGFNFGSLIQSVPGLSGILLLLVSAIVAMKYQPWRPKNAVSPSEILSKIGQTSVFPDAVDA